MLKIFDGTTPFFRRAFKSQKPILLAAKASIQILKNFWKSGSETALATKMRRLEGGVAFPFLSTNTSL